MSETPHVYTAISEVTRALSKEGISKDRKNQQQGYAFRGIDDVYNALAPFLADAGLCILPRVTERICTERESQKGGALYNVVARVEFDFVSAKDGTKHQVVTYGEAMDSADKATNKAMSAAYKYAAMQAFCIPTEGDNDADAHTPEPRASWVTNQQRQAPAPRQQQNSHDAQKAVADRRIAEEQERHAAVKAATAKPPTIFTTHLDADDRVISATGSPVPAQQGNDALPPQLGGPPINGKPWSTVREMVNCFEELATKLGVYRGTYDYILKNRGVKTPKDFKTSEAALAAYRELQVKVKELEDLKAQDEAQKASAQ